MNLIFSLKEDTINKINLFAKHIENQNKKDDISKNKNDEKQLNKKDQENHSNLKKENLDNSNFNNELEKQPTNFNKNTILISVITPIVLLFFIVLISLIVKRKKHKNLFHSL